MGVTVFLITIGVGISLSLLIYFFKLPPSSYPDIEDESAGIIVHGLMCRGWIKNKNKYPVVVKCTENGMYLKRNKWVQVLEPDQKIAGYHEFGWNYEIYTMDGLEVGFIHLREP